MPSFSSSQTSSTPMPAGAVIEAASRWLEDDEVALLGCECANPALQIERWGQDDGAAPTLAS